MLLTQYCEGGFWTVYPRDLAAQRLEMLKQLFLMTENQEHYIEYIENFDVSPDNIAKLNEYLDEHKLR